MPDKDKQKAGAKATAKAGASRIEKEKAAPSKKAKEDAIKREAGKKRAGAKTGVETAAMKAKIEKQKRETVDKILRSLDEKKIISAVQNGKLKPQLWDYQTKTGIEKVKKEIVQTGIPATHAAFVTTMFANLANQTAKNKDNYSFALSFFTQLSNTVQVVAGSILLENRRKKQAKAMLKNLSAWRISIARRSTKINPQLWDFKSPAGIKRLRKEWGAGGLGIITGNSAYWRDVFKQLEKSHPNSQFLSAITRPSKKYNAYTDPLRHLNELEGLTQDPDFASAVRQFQAIKKMVESQDTYQKLTQKGIREKDEDGILSEIGRVGKSAATDFVAAVKAHDWTTVGLYTLFAIAAYKSYKSLPKDKQERYAKYAWWGVLAYTGHHVLKKHGIDIPKKLGFKKEDAEVFGTPIGALKGLDLDLKPEDYVTARAVNFVNFGSLYDQYQTTNSKELRWVDPNQFKTAFGDKFAGMNVNDLKGTSAKQKEYRRKGESLYRVIKALEEAYDKTMRPKTGKTLGAILSSGIFKKSAVFDFAIELRQYVVEYRQEGIMASLKGLEKASTRLQEVFKGSGMGFNLDKGAKPGHYEGQLMGFPVVYVRDTRNKQFIVFAKSDYEKAGKNPNTGYNGPRIGVIPYKGSAVSSVTNLRKEIHAMVIGNGKYANTGLLSRFVKNSRGLATFSNVRYDYAYRGWTAEVSYKRGKIIKGTGPVPMRVNIEIGDDGRSISLSRRTGGQLVYIKDVLDANAFYGNMAISQLVLQKGGVDTTDFSALKWFQVNNRLDFDDDNPEDNKFKVKIRGVPIDLWIKLEKGKYMFLYSSDEAKLLRNGLFKRELRESVSRDKRWESAINNLKDVVASTPKDYFIHLLKSVPSWFTKATWQKVFRGIQLSHFTGSVAKLYTNALINAQKEKVMTDFQISLSKAKKLGDIGDLVNKTIPGAIADIKKLTGDLSSIRDRHTAEGKEFDQAEYSSKVLEKLMAIGCKSNDYKEWYRRFSINILAGNVPDDIRYARAEKIQQLMRVFAYYTAPIDDPSIDGANLYAKEPKPLPATASASEKAKYNKDLAEWNKAQKYRRYAAYAQKVSEQISLKMKTKSMVRFPDPSNAWWEIVPYSPEYAATLVSSHELIDTRPTWRLNKDFIGFDVYVEKLKKGEAVDENMVILPRDIKPVTVVMPTDPVQKKKAEAVLRKIMGGSIATFDKIAKTDLEIQFYNLLQRSVRELMSRYPSRARTSAFQKFLASYRIAYQVDSKKTKKGEDAYTFRMGHEIVPGTPRIKFRKGSNMLGQMATLDTFLSNSSITITKTIQTNTLKTAVEKVIQKKILNRSRFKYYFEGRGPMRWLQGVWVDFKDWLWGLKHKVV